MAPRWLAPVRIAVRVDESFPRGAVELRLSENARALRRISLAIVLGPMADNGSPRRRSRFSRSSALSRARASPVSPGSSPASGSACRTHLRDVSAVQPTFPAMDEIAAHCAA
jgi:hypothetical protein